MPTQRSDRQQSQHPSSLAWWFQHAGVGCSEGRTCAWPEVCDRVVRARLSLTAPFMPACYQLCVCSLRACVCQFCIICLLLALCSKPRIEGYRFQKVETTTDYLGRRTWVEHEDNGCSTNSHIVSERQRTDVKWSVHQISVAQPKLFLRKSQELHAVWFCGLFFVVVGFGGSVLVGFFFGFFFCFFCFSIVDAVCGYPWSCCLIFTKQWVFLMFAVVSVGNTDCRVEKQTKETFKQ